MLAVGYLEADARRGRPKLREEALTLLEKLFADRFSVEGGLRHTEDIGRQLGDRGLEARALMMQGVKIGPQTKAL